MPIDKEVETLVELVAIKAAKAAIVEAKEEWEKDISLHSAQCAAKKFKGVKNFICACVGGGIVAVMNWVLKK